MEQINIGEIINSLSTKYKIREDCALILFENSQEKIYRYKLKDSLGNIRGFTDRATDIKAYKLADRYLRMKTYLKNKNNGYTIEHLGFNK